LVAGWFSFSQMGATAGDLLTRDLVCGWLEAAGRPYDVAVAPPFTGGVDWQTLDPARYSAVVFVCGPFGNGWPIPEFLARFAGCRLIGVNLSMLEPLEAWNPFATLLERDSSATTRPDLVFLTSSPPVPVVGIVLVHPQKEYRNAAHDLANAAVERLVASRPMAAVRIDTRLDVNATGLRTPEEVESLIARMDVVVTTRLHGLVLAIKNGVPVVAIDPIAGGAKLRRQAAVIGWPACFTPEAIDDERILCAFEHGLTMGARARARECAEAARTQLIRLREQLVEAVMPSARAT
jgi:hypothetical protein